MALIDQPSDAQDRKRRVPNLPKLLHYIGALSRAIEARPVLVRWLVALPGALIASILFMGAMPLWMPAGPAGIDHFVMPVVLFPLIWVVFFTYTCMEENVTRATLVISCCVLAHIALIVSAF